MPLRCFCFCLPLLLVLGGCEPSWPARLPLGARLYEREGHRYFGKGVGFDAAHDFHNGTGPKPSILIEQPEGQEKVWGACATCADTFQIEKD